MQSIYEEDALPTLLGSNRQRQFLHDKGHAFGFPRGWEAHMPGGEMKASKKAVPEPLSPVAKKKQPKAKPQVSAEEQTATAAAPKLQGSNEIPCGPAFEALQQKVEALPHRRAAKVIGCHPQAKTGMNHLRDEWPISVSKAEKEFMAAVARNNVKRAEELLSEFGPSLMSGFGSVAILQIARNNLGFNWSLSNKMCELIVAQGEVPVLKQGGLVKHAGKELLGKTFKEGHKQFCLDGDITKVNAKENQAAARLGRSASVPHIWANISYPISVSKRSVSNTRIRRKPIYQSDA